jgi:hypothetical protein
MEKFIDEYIIEPKQSSTHKTKQVFDPLEIEANLGRLIKHAIAYEEAKRRLALI